MNRVVWGEGYRPEMEGKHDKLHPIQQVNKTRHTIP